MKATNQIIEILRGSGERVYFIRDAVFTSKWLIENCEFPCTLIVEKAEKNFERSGVGQFREVAKCRLIVLDNTNYEFQTSENDTIVDICNDKILNEIATLKNSALFDKFEIGSSKAVYDGAVGVVVTGASVDLACSVIVGDCQPQLAEINITDNGTYNVLGISKANVNVQSGGAVIEALNITPMTTQQSFEPIGLDGFAPVEVEAVTSAIDSKIVAGNIKQGVEILGVIGTLPDYSEEITMMIRDDVVTFKKIAGVWVFEKLINTSITTLATGNLGILCPENLEVENVGVVQNSALAYSILKSIKVGKLTTWSGVFGTAYLADLRKLEVGQDTNIGLGMTRWTAINVIAEGQSGIDELNANVVSGLANKLKDRSGLSALTINLSASLYSVLTADTLSAFTAKNWNVAFA